MRRPFRVLFVVFVMIVIALVVVHRMRVRQHSVPSPIPAQTAVPAPAPQPEPPQVHAAHIYNETADAREDVAGALALARSTHRYVLLDFGANWCPDCQMLSVYLHQPPNSELLEKNFILVNVDMGRMDKNLDVANTFNVPIKKGIPALAVVDPSGRVIFSQTAGEFANMRSMDSSSVTEFLKMWRPKGR